MGQFILFLLDKRAKICPKMQKLPKFCKQRSLEESWIYKKSPGTSLIGYSLTTAPHLFLPFNHISHKTYFSGMLCYFFLSDNLLCGMYYYQNLHLFSILTEYFHKKNPSKFVMISQDIKKTLFDFLYRPLLGFLISLWNILKFSGPFLEWIWTQSLVNNLQTRKKF